MIDIKNTKMLDVAIVAISTYVADHYMEISEENYFLLDSFKKQIIQETNKLKGKE